MSFYLYLNHGDETAKHYKKFDKDYEAIEVAKKMLNEIWVKRVVVIEKTTIFEEPKKGNHHD